MVPGALVGGARVISAVCVAMLSIVGAALAVTFGEFVDPHPAPGNQFGTQVLALSTGNVVITAPFDDAGGTDAGAVYLFNGATGALISTLIGSSANDNVGGGFVFPLTNGNYVIRSPLWNNGAIVDAGASTWGSGTTGVSGVVSAANSLVGSAANDGNSSSVIPLTNGNYVARNPLWNNGAIVDAGAVTWGNGTSGVSGVISAANSLVGSTANDQVGSNNSITALTNGNYVVRAPLWDNGAIINAGAVTWGDGTIGKTGVISVANSLVGSTAGDNIGQFVTALTNGNYVVGSYFWGNGGPNLAGAVTWGSGTTGVSGVISAANSLVGSANDQVGLSGAVALTNGNYVVASPSWSNGAIAGVGAATWGSGTTGVSGLISAANSLIGSTAGDQVGRSVRPLTNGNYVAGSNLWNNVDIGVVDAGAMTWGNGTTGVSGVISAANSLVGVSANDQVGSEGVVALTNGNYVVLSSNWNQPSNPNSGAATWGNGTSGTSGAVSTANSLTGPFGARVGLGGAVALTNGNYVVLSPNWDGSGLLGAVTWRSGASATSGVVTAANSLVGSAAGHQVGSSGSVTALTNGNYVVSTPGWDDAAIANVGATTWGHGSIGVSGPISAANSLIGSTANDGNSSGVVALTNGNYVVRNVSWNNGAFVDAGAVTWGNGASGTRGVISAANSLVGSSSSDSVGTTVTPLTNGDYVVRIPFWDNGALVDAGAATWGSGKIGVSGVVSAVNSLVGATANTVLNVIIGDSVNNTFIARFVGEGGGRVRVRGADPAPVILSAVDIPNDQGGWLRLTFLRSFADVADISPPVATYGVWRRVPGTLPAGTTQAQGATRTRPDAAAIELLRAALPANLAVKEVEGRLYVTGPGAGAVPFAATFPPGTWALITTVPALQQAQYVVDVPTINNVGSNDFVVTAHTPTASVWYVSDPVSGQSVDNLAPASPTGLTAAYSGGQTNLQWAANTEHDLGSYHIYRGTSAGFTPAPENLIASPITASYADIGPAGSYYKVSALDVNSNESGFTLITPQQTTGVESDTPVAFRLEGARPNPATTNRLIVAFALPTGASARLDLMDVSGRRLVSREVGSLGAGRHTVDLIRSRSIASGVYWVRLTQGVNRQTARVAVIE